MIVPAGVKVHLAVELIEMRKGMDGLAMLVQDTLKKGPVYRPSLRLPWPEGGDDPRSCFGTGTASVCSSWGRSGARDPRDGSAARAGGSKRCTTACARTCSPPTISLQTTRRSRCSIPAADTPRPGASGCTRATSEAGADRRRRLRSTCLRRTGKRSAQPRTWSTSRACCMSTAMRGFERLTSKEGVVLAACWAHTRHNLLGREDAAFDKAADAVVRNSESRGSLNHREPFTVLLGRTVGMNAVHPAHRADTVRSPGFSLTGRHSHPV